MAQSFESLGLGPNVIKAIKRRGYSVPTPLQQKAARLILSGADVLALARPGSGKTVAFLVPMFERLRDHSEQGSGARALILSPTVSSALRTLESAQNLGRYTDLRIGLLIGGDSRQSQCEELAQNPDIIVATPNRIMHHLFELKDLSLHDVEYVVFDEADSILNMGFEEQLHQIMAHVNDNRQTLLFSATLPSALVEFAKAGLRDPQLVRLDLISPDLKLVFFTLRQEEKHAALLYLIEEKIRPDEQTLIFVSTKYHVEFLNVLCQERGIRPSVCYGDMEQDARKMAVSQFRSRNTMLLIVTDLAARGIDIPLLDNVINWDFPPIPEIFVRRVGRAARAGRTGTAFSFVTNEDMPHVLDLHLFLSRPIRAAPTEEEVSHNVNNLMSKIDQAIANGESVYGRFPQTVLDLYADRVRELLDSSTELHSLERPCTKAFRFYNKTKAKPSTASVRRSKKLPRDGLHPIFKSLLGGDEITALAYLEQLKKYRPKRTILEAEGEVANSKKVKVRFTFAKGFISSHSEEGLSEKG
ncbi:hypothetical protein ACET3Z_015080 [Daucus carota]